jgi:hypothetical protein
MHAFDPSTWEAEAVGPLNSRVAWSTNCVLGQPRKPCLRKKKKKEGKKRKESKLRSDITGL